MIRGLLLFVGLVLAGGCGHDATPATGVALPQLTAVSPDGRVTWPFVFRWRGASADTVVRIRVMDDAERAVYGIEARGHQVTAPAPLKGLLEEGQRYQWRVSRVNENGDEAGTSELAVFTVEQ